jgi:hypothetical protein
MAVSKKTEFTNRHHLTDQTWRERESQQPRRANLVNFLEKHSIFYIHKKLFTYTDIISQFGNFCWQWAAIKKVSSKHGYIATYSNLTAL